MDARLGAGGAAASTPHEEPGNEAELGVWLVEVRRVAP